MHKFALLFVFSLSASAAFAGDLWVAVGYGGRRMISTDGRKWDISAQWAENGGDDSNNLISVVYGKDRFVAVGGGGWSRDSQAGHILTSPDGKEWTEVHKEPFRVNPVVFAGGKFIAGGPGRTLIFSSDGVNWEKGFQVSGEDFPGWAMWFRIGAFGNGACVFMGEGGSKKEFYWCITTKDGKTGTFRRDLPQLRALAFGAGTFVAVGGNVIMTSPDGSEWTKQERPADEKLDWIRWTGSAFLCGGSKCLESKDGKTWEPSQIKPPGRIVWTDGTRFIATQWPGRMLFSPDGRTWEKANDLTPNGINSVAHMVSR